MVYFIHDQTSRAVKIGHAWSPQKRLSELQVATPNKLVLLGAIAGTRRTERRVHELVYRHCAGSPADSGARPLCLRGEWFDDRILPFVTELLNSPATFLPLPLKKPARPRPVGSELLTCSLVLACDSGEEFRESFVLKATSPELARSALESIAAARGAFLAHTARITRLVVPGCPARDVSLRGTFVTSACNPREGLAVILNSEAGTGFATLEGVRQFAYRWFHAAPPELYAAASAWHTRPTDRCRTLLSQFAQVLNRTGCVVVAQTVLPVREVFPRGIGPLPKRELRSRTNRKAARVGRPKPAIDSRPRGGVVYFIQDSVTAAVKIGFCLKRPDKRLAALQTGNSNPLRLLGHVPGSERDERRLHRTFAPQRLQGEWFSGDILASVRDMLARGSLDVSSAGCAHDPTPEPVPVAGPGGGCGESGVAFPPPATTNVTPGAE